MRFIGLLMVAGVIGFSHSAEGREQNLDGDQGVLWVEGGIGTEVPENAIRVGIGDGFPLCRGTLAEELGKSAWWVDMGVVKPKNGKCHTLRVKKDRKFQESFYYLVPADTEGEVSTEGMVLEGDIEARIAEATAQLELDLEAASEKAQFYHDQTLGMVSESEIEDRIAEARVGMVLEADVEARIAEATVGMVPEAEVQAAVDEAVAAAKAELEEEFAKIVDEIRNQESEDGSVKAWMCKENDCMGREGSRLFSDVGGDSNWYVVEAEWNNWGQGGNGAESEMEQQAAINEAVAARMEGLVCYPNMQDLKDSWVCQEEVQERLAEAGAEGVSEEEVEARIEEATGQLEPLRRRISGYERHLNEGGELLKARIFTRIWNLQPEMSPYYEIKVGDQVFHVADSNKHELGKVRRAIIHHEVDEFVGEMDDYWQRSWGECYRSRKSHGCDGIPDHY